MKKLSSLLVLIFCLIPFVADAWILRDEFTTPLAAGSVNNTTSEPSGHTRTVIDTENKLSIADGKLTFSGGKALNDPGMKYPGITTQQGTVLLSCLSTFTSGITYIGLNNVNEIDKTIGITPNAGKWFSVEFGDDLPLTITSFPSCLAVTFSQLGHMWFGKDGESAYWKLGRVDKRTLLAATVYPVFGGHSLVGTFDFLRIPTTLWLPSPLASDGFGTAGVTDGLGHAEGVATGIGSGGGGLAWQSGGTTWSVSGGKAVNTAPSGIAQQVTTISSSTADILATVSIATVSAGQKAGLVTNLDSVSNPQNYILSYHDGTNVKLDKVVAGSATGVISAETAFSANAELRVIKDGTAYRVYYNDELVGTSQTISDASIINNTRHGLFSTDAANTLDNFTLYARGTGGEYNALNGLMNQGSGGGMMPPYFME